MPLRFLRSSRRSAAHPEIKAAKKFIPSAPQIGANAEREPSTWAWDTALQGKPEKSTPLSHSVSPHAAGAIAKSMRPALEPRFMDHAQSAPTAAG